MSKKVQRLLIIYTLAALFALGALSAAADLTGFGRARLSTFWFWVSGMASICIVAAGTM